MGEAFRTTTRAQRRWDVLKHATLGVGLLIAVLQYYLIDIYVQILSLQRVQFLTPDVLPVQHPIPQQVLEVEHRELELVHRLLRELLRHRDIETVEMHLMWSADLRVAVQDRAQQRRAGACRAQQEHG